MKPVKIVIIGGVAGGASAAARARRLDETAKITLIERGPDVSFANCGLPYHIGGEIAERDKLAIQTPQSLRQFLNIEVRERTEATQIDREAQTVTVRHLPSGELQSLEYDHLILAPGAAPLRPPLPGIDSNRIFTLRNLQDMDAIKKAASTAQTVTVIGAGFIGLEMAEQLVHLKKKVRLVELVNQVLPQMDPEMVQPVSAAMAAEGVELHLGDGIASFQETQTGISAALNSGTVLESDIAILSIGIRPENRLAKEAGLELGDRGHIRTNAFMQTSDPLIYAVGDVSETIDPILGGATAIPLGGPANRQGRVAANHILQGDAALPYPGSIGTAIVRVFNLATGVTGHPEKRLRQMEVPYDKTIVSDFQHASYFPGANHLTVKVLWHKETGKILGGQATGPDGVDKRLDVLATAIKGGLTVEDLEHLELSYAPPFGAAKDPLNTAGFSANNIRNGLLCVVHEFPDDPNVQLVDSRPSHLAEADPMEGAINLPFPTLRENIHRLDPSRPVVTACALGKMSYFAARVLAQNGFEVYAHVGGLKVDSPKIHP